MTTERLIGMLTEKEALHMFDIVPSRFMHVPNLWEEDDWFSTQNMSGLTVSEDDRHIYVKAAVPGVDPDDVEVTFENGMLWIRGESKEEEKGKKYYRKAASSFSYRIAVPGTPSLKSEPDASYKNGVMTVTFDKTAPTQPKKLKVRKT